MTAVWVILIGGLFYLFVAGIVTESTKKNNSYANDHVFFGFAWPFILAGYAIMGVFCAPLWCGHRVARHFISREEKKQQADQLAEQDRLSRDKRIAELEREALDLEN